MAGPGRAAPTLPLVRPALGQRRFRSGAVEAIIEEFGRQVPDAELAWLFGNCLAYSLDSTVRYAAPGGVPDTYVSPGDIDAMWLRDSAAQLWPYLRLAPREASLRLLLAGAIRRQARCIRLDPYASAFYEDLARTGASQPGQPTLLPGVQERKWAIDSLCYPLRLAYHYW
ncbi:MAG: metal-independent alpha-mannosidase, partial [Hymenobacter sp.]